MYSGWITSRHTVNWLGAHQKFNRMAYRQLPPYIQLASFPPLDKIQRFEGYNGPDGVKVKSVHRHDEPSHFYDPSTESGPLLEDVDNHYRSLVAALAQHNTVRAAFEAAWLAHTVTDGLTPAHHAPYEQELNEMYHNGNHTFGKPRDKIIMQGATKREMLRQNWQMWGSNGLLSMHIHFELGVAAAVITGNVQGVVDTPSLQTAREQGAVETFKREAEAIHQLHLYERFAQTSWTAELARAVRRQLAPIIIRTVATEWILAGEEAGLGTQ